MDAAQLFVPRATEALRPELPTAEFADTSGFAQMLQAPRPEANSTPREREEPVQGYGNPEPSPSIPDCDRHCDDQPTKSPESSAPSTQTGSTSTEEAANSSERPKPKKSEDESTDEQPDEASQKAAIAAGQVVAVVQVKVQQDPAAAGTEKAVASDVVHDVGSLVSGNNSPEPLVTGAKSAAAIKANEVPDQAPPQEPVIDVALQTAADSSQIVAVPKLAAVKKTSEPEEKTGKSKVTVKPTNTSPDSPPANEKDAPQDNRQPFAVQEVTAKPALTGAVDEKRSEKESDESPAIEEPTLATEGNRQVIELNDARRAEPALDAVPVSQPALEPTANATVHTPSNNSTHAVSAGAASSSPGTRIPNWLRGPTEGPSERGSVAVDSTRFLQRVTRAFEAAQSRGGNVRLRLSPPELGAVQIDLRVHEGVLSARLEAENPSARTALLDSLPALKERLAEQGMRIENFEVNVGSRGHGGTSDRPQDRPEEQRTEAIRRPRTTASTSPETARPRPWSGNGALNVMV